VWVFPGERMTLKDACEVEDVVLIRDRPQSVLPEHGHGVSRMYRYGKRLSGLNIG
jgi:hypothetical protein